MTHSPDESITEDKRDRLARLLEQRRTAPRRLSFGQEALWFEEQRAADSAVYNISVALHILSPIDVKAFERSVDRMVERHAQLRTRFPSVAGSPQAVTEAKGAGVFQALACRAGDESARSRQVNKEAQKPFDLEQGPLIRVRLFSQAEDDHLLLVVVHHLVADGWSIWLMLEELQLLYESEVQGAPAPLQPVGATYDDFVSWQRQFAGGEKWAELRDFWCAQFAGEQPLLDLPRDHHRPERQTFRGAVERFVLEPALVEGLRQLSQKEGVTLVSLLMAAFQVLLFRLTDQKEFTVGLPGMGGV